MSIQDVILHVGGVVQSRVRPSYFRLHVSQHGRCHSQVWQVPKRVTVLFDDRVVDRHQRVDTVALGLCTRTYVAYERDVVAYEVV